jgi:hypothetical protein
MAILIVPQQSLWSTSEQSASDMHSLFRALVKTELHVAVTPSLDSLLDPAPSPGAMDVPPSVVVV